MRILVVEDEKKIAQLVRKGLRENGFVVNVLNNGDEAMEAILSTPFDAVVLTAGRLNSSQLAAGIHPPTLYKCLGACSGVLY